MKRPILAISVVAAALVVVAILVKPTAETGEAPTAKREPLVATLAPRSKEITGIELVQGSKTLRLRKDGDGWVVPDAGNFRAETVRVNEILAALAGLEKVEAMTAPRRAWASWTWPGPMTGAPRSWCASSPGKRPSPRS